MENLEFSPQNAFSKHPHGECISSTLLSFENYCKENHLKPTPARKKTLSILLAEHKAIGAYEILSQLTDEGEPAHPPIVYRALDFLVEHGFAHKIRRLNAFVACTCKKNQHSPLFLVCGSCHSVAEIACNTKDLNLDAFLETIRFEMQRTTLEIEGLCQNCRIEGVR